MSVEFINSSNPKVLEQNLCLLESEPLWEKVISSRESIRRLVSLRGRLIGEKQGDKKDLLFDLNSYRGLGWKMEDVEDVCRLLISIEASYYRFASNKAAYVAKDYDLMERFPDHRDVALELVSWAVWYRWKPNYDKDNNDGLHAAICGSLNFIAQNTHKSFTSKLPLSQLVTEDESLRGVAADFNDKMKEMPEYRLRRIVNKYSLEEIFGRLKQVSPMERLAVLCVMGYVPGIANLTQGCRKYGIDPEALRDAFDRGLEVMDSAGFAELHEAASYIVNDALSGGVIRDPNGHLAFFNSPRIAFVHSEPPAAATIGETNLVIFHLARQVEAGSFKYSLTEIGKKVGGLTKGAVAHRLNYIYKQIQQNNQINS